MTQYTALALTCWLCWINLQCRLAQSASSWCIEPTSWLTFMHWHVGYMLKRYVGSRLLTAALTCWLYFESTCWLCVESTCWLCVELTCWFYVESTCWLYAESTFWLAMSWHVGCMLSWHVSCMLKGHVGWRLLTDVLTYWLVCWIDLLIFELFYSMQLLWTNCCLWL